MAFLRILWKLFSTFIAILILLLGAGITLCGGVGFVTGFGENGVLGIIIGGLSLILGISIVLSIWKIFGNIWKSKNSTIDTLTEEKSTTPETKQSQ